MREKGRGEGLKKKENQCRRIKIRKERNNYVGEKKAKNSVGKFWRA